jgi:hypothetical protein
MTKEILIPTDIKSQIYTIRGVQVMLDEDLAVLYQTQTRILNQAVKRNIERFPREFCFKLTTSEFIYLKSQIVTSSLRSQFVTLNINTRRKYLPYAFTEQGVAMLSGVLKSEVAVRVSIQIMSEFVAMRKVFQTNSQIFTRLDIVEQKQIVAENKIDQVFDALASHDDIPKQKLFFENEVFDAHIFVSRLIRKAKKDITLIDNFVDENVLKLFLKRKTKVSVVILTNKISPSLALDLAKYNAQYPAISIKEFALSHDRFLIIDQKDIYHFGASIKDLGKKWFVVSKIDGTELSLLSRLTCGDH